MCPLGWFCPEFSSFCATPIDTEHVLAGHASFGRSLDSAERAQQILGRVPGRFSVHCRFLSIFRLHNDRLVVGMGLPYNRLFWRCVVRCMAVLRVRHTGPASAHRSNGTALHREFVGWSRARVKWKGAICNIVRILVALCISNVQYFRYFRYFRQRRVPWLQIWTSKAVWINIIGQFGGIWCYVTIMTQLPTYFTNVFGWGPQMTGILTGIPQGLRMIFAYLLSMLIDHILLNNWMSRDNVRKLAGGLSTVGIGVLVLVAAFAGCNSTVALTFLALANMLHGSVSSGPLASLIDMSPNFSGITMGIASFFVLCPGVISAYVVGKITMGNVSSRAFSCCSSNSAFKCDHSPETIILIFHFSNSNRCSNGNWFSL